MKMSGESGGRRICLSELNDHITCKVCGGYFRDATTVKDCFHTFCKACIVTYLEANKQCPICKVLIPKQRLPTIINPDQILQDLVYKIVPGYYQNEIRNRQNHYAKHPEELQNSLSSDAGQETVESRIYSPDEPLSISLEYHSVKVSDTKQPPDDEGSVVKNLPRRYFKCPAAVTVFHLQKLIRAKYGLTEAHQIDILFEDELLSASYSLMDVMYIHHWKRKVPLHLSYRIFETAPKRLKLSDDNDEFKLSLCNSGIGTSKTAGQNEADGEWKEVQLKISETGVMSITDISTPDSKKEQESESVEKQSSNLPKKIEPKTPEAKVSATKSKLKSKLSQPLKSKKVKSLINSKKESQKSKPTPEPKKEVEKSNNEESKPGEVKAVPDKDKASSSEKESKEIEIKVEKKVEEKAEISILQEKPKLEQINSIYKKKLSEKAEKKTASTPPPDSSSKSKPPADEKKPENKTTIEIPNTTKSEELLISKSPIKIQTPSMSIFPAKNPHKSCPDAIPISMMKQPLRKPDVVASKGAVVNEICAKISSAGGGSKINDICAKIGENYKEKSKLPDLLKISSANKPKESPPPAKHIPNIPNVPSYSPTSIKGIASVLASHSTSLIPQQKPKSWTPTMVKQPNRSIPSKPAKIFEGMRNTPRVLGNPALGVKPMYGVSSEPKVPKVPGASISVTKIDPQTLSPIVSSNNSPIVSPPPYSPTSRNYHQNAGFRTSNPFIPSHTPNTNPRSPMMYLPFPGPFSDAEQSRLHYLHSNPLIRSSIGIPPTPSAYHSSLPPSITSKSYHHSGVYNVTQPRGSTSSSSGPASSKSPKRASDILMADNILKSLSKCDLAALKSFAKIESSSRPKNVQRVQQSPVNRPTKPEPKEHEKKSKTGPPTPAPSLPPPTPQSQASEVNGAVSKKDSLTEVPTSQVSDGPLKEKNNLKTTEASHQILETGSKAAELNLSQEKFKTET